MKKTFLISGLIATTLFLFSFKSTKTGEQEMYNTANYTVNMEVISVMREAKDMSEDDAAQKFGAVKKAAKWAWDNDCKLVVWEVVQWLTCCGEIANHYTDEEITAMEAMGVISQL